MEVARCSPGSLDCTCAKSAAGMPSVGRSLPVLQRAVVAGSTGMKRGRTASSGDLGLFVIMTRWTGCSDVQTSATAPGAARSCLDESGADVESSSTIDVGEPAWNGSTDDVGRTRCWGCPASTDRSRT